ncbi:MAG: HugZ family protein [Parvibaculaceae bacterium]
MTTAKPRSFSGLAARQLLRRARTGMLATLNQDGSGPYASLVNIATDLAGRPVIFISTLAWHTRNLARDGQASILTAELPAQGDALTGSRVTVMGRFAKIEAKDIAERYAQHHPAARLYLDFPDFSFWRLEPQKIHAVAGFGRIETIESGEVFGEPQEGWDGLMAGAAQHVNADHADTVQLYAEKLADAQPGGWQVTAVDCDGFLIEKEGQVHRIGFDEPALSPAALRQAFVKLAAKVRNS